MEVNRESILSKTHYGLNIYSYVLRQYYPDDIVLSLSGRDCKPTKNPFNADKPTLKVSIVDNCAIHKDLEEAIAPGSCFDFASLHFGLSGQELYDKINEALYLRIDQKKGFYNNDDKIKELIPEEPVKPKPPKFSYFRKPITNIKPDKEISLIDVYKLIKGDEFAACTSTLRNIQEVKKARKYKAYHFDYVTFSGTFSQRNDKHMRKHSGLLTIDFDHVSDLSQLKTQLLDDQYFETELLFVSPSGDGLKWIIPIELTKVKHQDYFKAVANYILHTYQLEVDQSGKDISRACFLPHDPEIFINPKYL